MRPAQILDERGALLENLQSGGYQRYLKRWMTELDRRGTAGPLVAFPITLPKDIVNDGSSEKIRGTMIAALQMGESYFVEASMTTAVYHASSVLPENERFRIDMLPSPMGFAFFEVPIFHPTTREDVDRSVENIARPRALVWVTLNGRVLIGIFHDFRDPDGALIAQDGNEEDQAAMENLRRMIGNLVLIHMIALADSEQVGSPIVTTTDEPEVPIYNPTRDVVAFWKMLGETVVDVSEADVERPFRRRAVRKGIPARVSVIKLRRTIHPDGGHSEGHIEWQHRWWVRGHHAWRKCGPNHPLAEPDPKGGYRCRVYIRQYEKGPEGAPFLPNHETIYTLAR